MRVEPAVACLPADDAETPAKELAEAPTEASGVNDVPEADQGQDTDTDADQ